ncbi:hypothetical protein N7540_005536 [Penicillium herquei]|nr:hypothetical protein N7540_005536 [Penicillium herquei]
MSNFVHKVKDAITDHEKPVTRSQVSGNRTNSATNPFSSGYNESQSAPKTNNKDERDYIANRPDHSGYNDVSGPDPNTKNFEYEDQPTSTATETNASYPRPDYSDPSRSTNKNPGPHQSGLANKLDPRVDTGSERRADQTSAGPQTGNVSSAGGMDPRHTAASQPISDKGMDQHTSSEDNFSRSTQEHRSQQQPIQHSAAGQAGSEDFETSTEEQKSHKSSSHISPCTSTTTKNEPIFENTQPQFGGNASGGSSYNEPVNMRESQEVSHNTLPQKPTADAGANRAVEQQDTPSDQRVRY